MSRVRELKNARLRIENRSALMMQLWRSYAFDALKNGFGKVRDDGMDTI